MSRSYKKVEGGVCAALGYRANGLNCGLNADPAKNDLALVVSEVPARAAAVYTRNKVQAAPIRVTKSHLAASGGLVRAIIANSKNANACNENGDEVAEQMCALTAETLQVPAEQVLVASTGVIGQKLPLAPIANHLAELAAGLSAEHHDRAVNAIMTTDTVPKESAVSFVMDGKTCTLGGMSKGSGMIHPNMATTLTFVTTDACVTQEVLQQALREVIAVTYNCLSIDGDTSTNDMACVLANGCAGNAELTSVEGEDYGIFKGALQTVMTDLVRMLAKDGEGASKLLVCTCSGAPDYETAITVAKSVIRSPLLKCAMFGEDANCGRILCAAGYAEADFDVNRMDVDLASAKGQIAVCRAGNAVEFSEERASEVLAEDEITILLELHQGEAQATAYGCDLTYDYVRINGDYRS